LKEAADGAGVNERGRSGYLALVMVVPYPEAEPAHDNGEYDRPEELDIDDRFTRYLPALSLCECRHDATSFPIGDVFDLSLL
jgi:hypothetical protein